MVTYTLKVAEIRQETKDAVTLCFKQPSLRKIKYLAGQYLTLIFRINGRRYIRPYSFSSCPGVDSYLEVTVKRVANGIVSNHINDLVKPGDSIEVMQPMGDFIFSKESGFRTVYLWGVGSGITPLISIAKQVLQEENINVYLIYGNKSHESTIFAEQIESLLRKHSTKFIVKHFRTSLLLDQRNNSIISGRITQHKVVEVTEDDPNLKHSAHYICGPAGFKDSVSAGLSSLSIKNENIFFEHFEVIKNPSDFADIYTQNVKLRFNKEEFTLEVIKGKSILESALEFGLELPYSCQTGNCSTCKAKIQTGKVAMLGLQQKREDILSDECLLCCSYPFDDTVYVSV